MYAGLVIAILFFNLELCYSQCLINCTTDNTTFQCHITATSTELDDNWIESCHDPPGQIQFLEIFITNYPYTTLPINSPANLPINNIIINFDQPQSLTLNSNISNSNISSLTLSGDNPFTNGLKEFLSHFSNLVSLYIMNNTQLHYLEDGSFVSLTRLQLLTVERVGIEIIGDNLFNGLSELKRLEWTNSFTYMLSSSAFFHLTSLQYLNLRNNQFASINCDLFQRILNLKQINLASNLLSSLPSQSFQQMPNLTLLRLESNPLACDCNMFWLEYAESFFNLTVVWPCGGTALSPVQQASNGSYQNILVCSNGTNTSLTNITQSNSLNSTLNATLNTSNLSVPVINNTVPVSNISLCYNITVLKTVVNTTANCQSFQYTDNTNVYENVTFQNNTVNVIQYKNTTTSLLVNTTAAPTMNSTHPLPSVNICSNKNNFTCNSPSQPCQHTCTNSPTSFNCSCDNGFYLEPDGFSCTSNLPSCPADYSYCSVSSCCIPSLYSCPLNLTDTLQLEMGVTVLQVSPLQEVVNRSILLSSADDQISLNLSLSVSCHVLVLSCEVYWLECFKVVMNFTLSESFPLQFSLPSADRDSPLHYLLLRVEGTEDKLVQLYERLLVVIQSSDPPTLYTRSLVRASTVSSNHVLIGAAVSSLEASMCADECPYLSVSLFSVGLIEVNISNWEGVSIQVVSCVSLPSQYWMSYNSYLFSIEWKNVSSQLNGRYELRVNGSGFVAVTEFSIDYPAADNACEGRLEMGVYWEWRINGTTASIPCSDLFGQEAGDTNSSLTLSSSCTSDLQWDEINSECILSGNRSQILVFAAEFIPSNRYFVSLQENTTYYLDNCLSTILSIYTSNGFDIFDEVTNDNFVFYRLDVSNISIDNIIIIMQDSFELLNNKLEICLLDYSITLFVESLKCDCKIERSLDVFSVIELCHIPACSCLGDNCSCISSNDYIGSGLNCSYDSDGDDYPDYLALCLNGYCIDNCLYTYNPLQYDCDENGIGDACTSYLDFKPDIVTRMNRTIVLEPGMTNLSLNLTFFHKSVYTVRVESCEVGWIECKQSYIFNNLSNSVNEEIELSLNSDWNLNYLILSTYHYENDSKISSVRLLVISQNLSVPEFQSRSFVSGDRVWIGVSVSSCTSECPELTPSLWSIGLRDVNITDMTDYFSIELESCEFLPSIHWFGFSSYIFSILVKHRIDTLNGRYKFVVTDGLSSVDGLFMIFYEGLPQACSDELFLGLYWNWTAESETLSIPCSELLGEYGDMSNDYLSVERSCLTGLQFSPLSLECSFDGYGDQFLMFSFIFNPSNFFFSTQNNSSLQFEYFRECLDLVDNKFLDSYDADLVQKGNTIYSRFNTTLLTTDDITSNFTRQWFEEAREVWDMCVDNFSLLHFVQSLKCDCIHDVVDGRDHVSVVEICHRQACYCTVEKCNCNNSFLGDGLNCSDDTDRDLFPDFPVILGNDLVLDNCPYTYNPLQYDCDENGVGDACTSYLDFEPDIVTRMNRTIVLEPGMTNLSLNLTFFHKSVYTVRVESCEVGWIECKQSYIFNNLSNSVNEEIELSLNSDWNLNYLILSTYHYENDSKISSVRLLVISQNLSVPEFQSRSFVSGDRVWIGVSVSSCTSECPELTPSLWSIGLRDVNITDMIDYFSIELESCEFLPSIHWFGFSSYIFSILVNEVTDLLNGQYRVNVTGDIIQGHSAFRLLYPGLNDACESDLDLGLYWNWTKRGEGLSISCFDLIGEFSSLNSTDNSNLERECGASGEWSGISGQCGLKGSTKQVIILTFILNPSNKFFLSKDNLSVNYSRECLGELLEAIPMETFTDLDPVYIDNLVYFRLDASLAVNNDIQIISNNIFVPLLNEKLESCIDDYSIYALNQSTICECKPNTSEAIRERVNLVNLCDELACSCPTGSSRECECTEGFYGDGKLCSFDTDSDGLPDNPVLCDGVRLCYDSCPFQSRCFEEEGIPAKCEFVCPEEIDNIFNITWPCTAVGAKRYVHCPQGEASASRICRSGYSWGTPNTTLCVSDKFANLTGNSTQKLALLVVVSESALSVSGDVIVALGIVTENSEIILDTEDIEAQKEAVIQAANVISNIVRTENTAVLNITQINQPVVQQIITALTSFANTVSMTEEITINNSPNVFIGTRLLVPDPDNDNMIQLTADNIKIGEEERSPSITIPVNRNSVNRTSTVVVVNNLGNILSNLSEFLIFGRNGISINYFRTVTAVTPILTINITNNGTVVEEIDADILLPIDIQPEKMTYFRPICVHIKNQNLANPHLEQEVNETTAGDSVKLVNCHAQRPGSFLVLVGINDLADQSIVLNIISYVGCSLSTICLALSISIYILFGYKLLKKIYHFVHFNLALSLLLTYLVFLLGLELPYVNVLEYIPCKLVSVLMQYVLLSMFLWMLMEGVVIFIMINFPFRRFTKKFFFAFFCISYLSPLLYVLAVSPFFHPYLISPPFFGNQEETNISNLSMAISNETVPLNPTPGFCWIHNDEDTNLIFAVTAPILLIIIINIFIFAIVTIRCIILIRKQKSVRLIAKSQKLGIRLFRLSLVLFPILGFGWSFGLIAVISHVAIFAWVFTILGSGQGVFILFFVLLIRKDIRVSILRALNLKAKLSKLSSKITSQITKQTTAAPFYWNLARMLENNMLTRSTLELAKQQGLISPIVELDQLMVFLEEKPWENRDNPDAMDEWDLEYLRNQLTPETEPEKPGLPPIFEITQLMTFLEERSLEERTKNTVVTDLSVLNSSIFLTDVDAIQAEDTYSRDINYQGKDSSAYTEFASKSDANIQTDIDEEKLIKPNPEAESNGDTSPGYQAEHENTSYDIPQLLEIEVGLLELQEVMAQVDTPATRIAPKHVIEIQPDEFPTLKSVRENPRTIVVPPPTIEHYANIVIQDKARSIAFDNIPSLFTYLDSEIPTTQLPITEIVESIPPPQEDPIESLDFLIDQIDDLLTDIDTLNPFTRI